MSCLQALFGFFNELNSYWVAPLVNLVFVLVAILAQLFLMTKWGRDVLAWMNSQMLHVKGNKSIRLGTEQRRLLTATSPESFRLYSDDSDAQNELSASVIGQHSSALHVELSDAHNPVWQCAKQLDVGSSCQVFPVHA